MQGISFISSLFKAPEASRTDGLTAWRERILTALLRSAALLGLVAYLAALGSLLERGQWVMVSINTASYVWLLLITVLRRLPYRLRAGSGLLLLLAIGVGSLLDNALSGSGRVFLLAFVAISGLLMGLRVGIAAAVLSTAILVGTGFLMNTGQLPLPPLSELSNSTRINAWIIASSIFFLLSSIVVIPLAALVRGLENSLKTEGALIAELEAQRDSLEEQVRQRTQDLQQRLLQIRASSELAYIVGSSEGISQLLHGAANLIARRFAFPVVEIYLADRSGSHPLLEEYVSSGPAQVLSGDFSYVELPAFPAQVIREKSVIFREDIDAENPLIEAGFPIASGEEVLGALLVQAEKREPFSNDILEEIKALCSQLASAIHTMRLQTAARYSFEDMQKRLKILETLDAVSHAISVETNLDSLYRVIHEQVVKVMGEVDFMITLYNPAKEQFEVPYAYENGQFLEIPPFPLGQGLTSILIRSGKPLLLKENVPQQAAELGALTVGAVAKSWLGVPLLIAGEPIGAVIVQDPETEGRFTEEDQRLVENMASQIAVMVRNTSLLEEARRRAEREAMINQISSEIRSSMDTEVILQNTVRELGKAVGASRAFIQLGIGSAPDGAGLGSPIEGEEEEQVMDDSR